MLSPSYGQVTHALLARPPLSSSNFIPKNSIRRFSFDLHVLGTPPAFVLSQDQTLVHICFRSLHLFRYSAGLKSALLRQTPWQYIKYCPRAFPCTANFLLRRLTKNLSLSETSLSLSFQIEKLSVHLLKMFCSFLRWLIYCSLLPNFLFVKNSQSYCRTPFGYFQELTLFIFQCTSRCLSATRLLYHIYRRLSIPFSKVFCELYSLFSLLPFSVPPLADSYISLPHTLPFVNCFFQLFLSLCIIFIYGTI